MTAGRASFLQLYVPVSLERAQHNNLQRPPDRQVHSDIISGIHAKLEPPDPCGHPWEAASVTWHGDVSSVPEMCVPVFCFLMSLLDKPHLPQWL